MGNRVKMKRFITEKYELREGYSDIYKIKNANYTIIKYWLC